MSCPLDRLEALRKPPGASPASPAPASHPAVGTRVYSDCGSGVVDEVKEYEGTQIMVIKMDIAGTMSCPLDRLEAMSQPVADQCADVDESVAPVVAAPIVVAPVEQ